MKTPAKSRARTASGRSTSDAKVGRAIKRLRRERGLSLDVVAARAGISTSFLSRLENGQRELTLATMAALAQAVGVTTAELVTLSNEPPTNRADESAATPAPDTMAYLRAHACVGELGHHLLWIGQRWPASGAAAMDAGCALHAGLTAMMDASSAEAALQDHGARARRSTATRHTALVDKGEAQTLECQRLAEVLGLMDRMLDGAQSPSAGEGQAPATAEGAHADV